MEDPRERMVAIFIKLMSFEKVDAKISVDKRIWYVYILHCVEEVHFEVCVCREDTTGGVAGEFSDAPSTFLAGKVLV